MRAHSWVLLAVLVLPVAAAGQAPRDWRFAVDRFGLEDGLPGNAVTDLDIGSDGRLWVLVSGRIVSFDGLTFQEHAIEEAGTRRVACLTSGSADTLWICAGPRLLALAGGKVHSVAGHDRILRDVWQEDDGTLWAWDDLGYLRAASGSLERMVDLPDGWNRGRLGPDEALPPRSESGRVRYVDPRAGIGRVVLGRWLADPMGFPALWPGARERGDLLTVLDQGDFLRVASGESVVEIPDLPGRRPLDFDSRGLLWATSPSHLEAFTEDGRQVVRISAEGSTVGHRTMREDARGNLWMGTRQEGLLRLRPLPVQVLAGLEGLPDGQVHRVSHGGEGLVLVLDERGTLYRTDGQRVDTVGVPGGGPVQAALTDRRGTLWVMARSEGRALLSGHTSAGEVLRAEIPDRTVRRIVEDPDIDGLLWIVGDQLSRVRGYEAAGPAVEPPLLSFETTARDLLISRAGDVWIAHREGLTRWSEDGARTFLAEAGHPTLRARALHEDDDGTLWIGRYFGGIVRFRDGRFDEIRAEDGLWEDVVSSILEDDQGNLWMGGNRGIHRVPRRALVDFVEGRIPGVPGRGYGPDAGFRNPESSGWPGHRTADGRLWFPTFEGVAVVDPARVLPRDGPPPGIRLLGVRGRQAVLAGDSVARLPRGDRRVEFGFAAIDLSDAGTHRYEVLLEGVDEDWVDVGRQRSTVYSNVPPGRRDFRVRAVTAAGVASAEPAVVALVVPPFFHETRSFAFLVLLLGATLVWGGFHLRSRRLRANAAELERLVESRTRELTRARADAEEALTTVGRQAQELRLLGEAKSRFFANVSHELRTPLTLVNGPLREVLDGRFGTPPEAVQEQLSLVEASGRRLGELVEQLLDVARLDAGKLELRRAPVDLRPLLLRLGRSFASLAAARDIRLTVSLPGDSVVADVDADQIEKVVANLLSNAVKFTPRGGRVAFSVAEGEGEWGPELVLRVQDDGPGIAAPDHDQVFERFQRRADESAGGGTGLGLALVREITELHGGRVELRSAPGKGSRFTVILPKGLGATAGIGPDAGAALPSPLGCGAANSAPPSTEAEAEAGSGPSTPEDGDATATGPATEHEADDANGEVAERPTVLIVEDHDGLRAYIRRQLDDRYRVVEARDGLEGLEAARRTVPDLILCDIMMPGMDGDELCRLLRSDAELDYLPVIMLTARASRESRLSALEGGADDYLVKPFDPEELTLRVDNLLAGRKRHAEHLRVDRAAWREWAPPRPRSDPAFAEQFFALLRERAGEEDFGTPAMAKALAMSRTTLYRKVADSLDGSPAELLWTFRLEQAAQWLEETDARVSDVAYGCGFRTVPHFTRKFKERYGTTPAAWRKGVGAGNGSDPDT